MSVALTINGAIFNYPQPFDTSWGVDATGWAQAVTSGMLQKAGGSFTLTADVDFGASFGLKSAYFETRSANPATSGTVRLSSADAGVTFRNNANSGNLILTTNSSDNLLYNGQVVALSGSGSGSSPTFTNVTLSNSLILDDTEVSPKTITVSAPSVLSTNWALKFPINPGSSGQILQTDGSGNTSWVNASGTGTVNSGAAGNFSYYATSSNAVSDSGVSITAPTFSGGVNAALITLHQSTNQLQFTGGGGGNQVRILSMAPTTTVGELMNVPDVGSGANFIMDQGTQAINGSKSFTSPLSMSSQKITSLANGTAAQDAVALSQLAANYQFSGAAGSSATGSVATSVTITTHGGAVLLIGHVTVSAQASGNEVQGYATITNGTSAIPGNFRQFQIKNGISTEQDVPVTVMCVDTPIAGTYTYNLYFNVTIGTIPTALGPALMALELHS